MGDLGHPEREAGLFETVLIAAGRPVALDAHLSRLAASAAEVFGRELPDALAAELREAAAGVELGRLRIAIAPAGGGLRHGVEIERIDPAIFFPSQATGAELRSVRPPVWDTTHKWADRSWLESTEAELGEQVPLIVGPGEEVLEAGRANVFAVRGESLVTPAADGRILAGTARRAVLDLAAELAVPAAEGRLTVVDLAAADGVFLTSSVRGIRPARSLDGVELPGSALTDRLAAELRRRWLEG